MPDFIELTRERLSTAADPETFEPSLWQSSDGQVTATAAFALDHVTEGELYIFTWSKNGELISELCYPFRDPDGRRAALESAEDALSNYQAVAKS